MMWTQEEMARQWSYSFETISAWERGKRTPSSQEIPRLAKFLEMEPEQVAEIVLASRKLVISPVNKPLESYEARSEWKASMETWGELLNIYRTRTDFNKEFSYPRMFENAHSILAAGISLNAIALNYDREILIRQILDNNCVIQLCFLKPWAERCREREEEERHPKDLLSNLTDTNIKLISLVKTRVEKVDKAKVSSIAIKVYDMIPRFNIYIVNDTLMTVQHYAFGRGEETPILVLKRKTRGGLFDYYLSAAQHILEHSQDINEDVTQ